MRNIGKNSRLRALIASLVFFWPQASFARIIGTNPTGTSADTWCEGGRVRAATTVNATELCIDSSGNFIPTTNNSQQLGTSSLQYSDLETTNINSGGASLTIGTGAGNTLTQGTAGTTNSSGKGGAAASQSSNLGLTIYTPYQVGTSQTANLGIYSSTTIPVNSSFEMLLSSGVTGITLTSTPNIATTTVVGTGIVGIPNGTLLVLGSTAAAIIQLQDNTALAGSQIKAYNGAATISISSSSSASFIFSSVDSFWHQIAR